MGQGLATLAFVCALPLAAQQPSYIGAEACGKCHAAELAKQSASPHAASLHRATEHPLAGNFASDAQLERPPNFQFEFSRTASGLRVRASDGKYVTELPIEWAFGAGVHAVTFVSKVSAEFYIEHSFSYYADTKSLDITPRHDALPVKTLQQAMGQPLRSADVKSCFQCHSTGPVSVEAAGEGGVRCEACHEPGSAHRDAVLRGQVSRAKAVIRNPGTLSAEKLNELCGACHRALTADFNWESPWNVRHQPPFLARSACFQKSEGRLSCLTCHDPHDRARRADAAYYRAKCLSCHAAGGEHGPKAACGVAVEADCASCHMPAVRASEHLEFRNHWIGVYREGAKLRPGGLRLDQPQARRLIARSRCITSFAPRPK